MASEWMTYILSQPKDYVGVCVKTPTECKSIEGYKASSCSCFLRYHNTQRQDVPEKNDKDFIRSLIETIRQTEGPLLVADKSDMTLLCLLYHSTDHELYLSESFDSPKAISISKLKSRIRRISNAYTSSTFFDYLFLLPMVILTGIPNIVCLQVSAIHDMPIELLKCVDLAQDCLFNRKALTINIKPFVRVFKQIDECEYTAKVARYIDSKRKSNFFDPSIAGLKEYAEAYYLANDFVEEDQIKQLSIKYVDALIHLSEYLRNGKSNTEFNFYEAPLLASIIQSLEETNVLLIKQGKVPYKMVKREKRILNRTPYLSYM
jgi:hypothetical protein